MSFLQGYAKKLGVLEYLGTWDAFANSPILTSSVGQKGGYYVVSNPGSTNLDGITDWSNSDWVIFNGTSWEKIDNSERVTSVASKTGDVQLVKNDVGLGNVDNTSDVNKPVSTEQLRAIKKISYYYAIVL